MAEQGTAQYGGFWIRFLAYLVDGVILMVVVLGLLFASVFLGAAGALIAAFVPFVVPLAYFVGMQASARQATFGKALLGLKVGRDGERLSTLRSLGRELAKYVSAIPLAIGFLIAAFTARKQALHDFIASTTVVREGPSHVVAALAIVLVGFLGPVILVVFLGVGILGAFGAGLVAGFMGEHAKTMQSGKPAPQAQKPAAPAPQAVPAKPAAPAPAPAPAVAKPAAPAPAPAPVVAKPAPTPAPAPTKVAAVPAPMPAKPVAAAPAPVPETPKPAPRKRAAAPKPAGESAIAAPAPAPAPVARVLPAPKYSDLMSAVLARDTAGVQELLDFGKWVDKPDRRGSTPLMVAVGLGDAACAEALLKAGASAERAMPVAQDMRNAAMTALLQRYGARR